MSSWTKDRVSRGIYKRTSPPDKDGAQLVAYLAELRTKRGTMRATFSTLGSAEKARAKWINDQRTRRAFGSAGRAVHVCNAVDAYRDAKGITRQGDVTKYNRLQFWSDRLGKLPLVEVDGRHIAEALESLDVTGSTRNRYRAAFSSLWKWSSFHPRSWVRNEGNPVKEVPAADEPRHREVTLSKAQRAALIESAKAYSVEMGAAVTIALLTGMRHGELASLTWGGVTFGANSATAVLTDTKNGDSRAVVFTGPALAALKSLTRGIGTTPVFSELIRDRNRLRGPWLAVKTAAGLPTLRFHDCRHVAAQLQVEAGSTLAEVMLHLGHKSAQTSRRYSALSTAHGQKLADRAAEVL